MTHHRGTPPELEREIVSRWMEPRSSGRPVFILSADFAVQTRLADLS